MNPLVPSHARGMLLGLSVLLFLWIVPKNLGAEALAPALTPLRIQTANEEEAIRHWRRQAEAAARNKDLAAQVEAWVNLTALYEAGGYHALAHETARRADDLASGAGLISRAAAKNALGMVLLFQRETEAAEHQLTLALAAAVQTQQDRLIAQVLNNVGNLAHSRNQFTEAAENYQSSAAAAARAGDLGLQAKALANQALALLRSGQSSEAGQAAGQAQAQLESIPTSPEKNTLLLTLGAFWDQRTQLDPQGGFSQRATNLYQEALQSARALGDPRAAAYAAGYLGRNRARASEPAQAEDLLLEAITSARQAGLRDALFRWQWELARLKKDTGKKDQAIVFYEQAIETFQPLLTDWVMSVPNWQRSGSFRDEISPLYFELADLLLQMASTETSPAKSQALLYRAQETMELLKAGEFADYFQEPCVDREGPTRRKLTELAPGAAVLYVIPLADRLELLVEVGDTLHRFSSNVEAPTLTAAVRDFRRKLEKRSTREYMAPAQKLDRWLIAPAIELLQSHDIKTLVFVPDGPLRTVPPAAFHDGKQFLNERFALAVVPGLTLMDPKPLRRVPRRMLLSGLSESVQGFPSLDYVPQEVAAVHAMFGGKVLLNQSFDTGQLRRELNSHAYSLVHVASHAEFFSELSKTALLTYDGRVGLSQLEEFIRPCQYLGRPVELLTLSACQTAAGDDRAALGLAGVALKAGARSALATLWFVNDQASAVLVSDFYRQLSASQDTSKAAALRAAQLHLMEDPRYQHPAYWAPYLIIGNWL